MKEVSRTSQIPDPRAAEHADELARGPAVVADRDHVAEWAVPLLHDVVEDVHQAVGGRAAGDHDDAVRGGAFHCGQQARDFTSNVRGERDRC